MAHEFHKRHLESHCRRFQRQEYVSQTFVMKYTKHKKRSRLSRSLKLSSTGWYIVNVIHFENYEEVLNAINKLIFPLTLYPYDLQIMHNMLEFLVDSFKIVKILHDNNGIVLKNGQKLSIKVNSHTPSRAEIIRRPVSKRVIEVMTQAMNTRYNPSTKCLDLSSFHKSPLFTENQMFVPLNQPAILIAALNIVAQHTKHDLYGLSLKKNFIYLKDGLIWIRRLFPELKVLDLAKNKIDDIHILNELSGFEIEKLDLSKNLITNHKRINFKSLVQNLFPKIVILNNKKLSNQTNTTNKTQLKMPVNLGSNFSILDDSNTKSSISISAVESFLSHFYERYDKLETRQSIAEAYHTNATFSLSCCILSKNVSQSNSEICDLHPYNINNSRKSILKGKQNIVKFLSSLPETKHDIEAFYVDIPFSDPTLTQIVVNGIFSEASVADGKLRFRSFCRIFNLTTGDTINDWGVLSDMLFITTASDELITESMKWSHMTQQYSQSTEMSLNLNVGNLSSANSLLKYSYQNSMSSNYWSNNNEPQQVLQSTTMCNTNPGFVAIPNYSLPATEQPKHVFEYNSSCTESKISLVKCFSYLKLD